jgi:homoserine acetyltransferase
LAYLPDLAKKLAAKIDANDWIYQLRVNNHFDVAASLDSIEAQVLAIELDGDEMVPVELGQMEEVKGRLGERVEYLLFNDTGRGHSALPSIIQHIGPRIGQFLSKLS